MFYYLVQADGQDNLPQLMLDKLVCAKAFNYRSEEVGPRLKLLVESLVFEDFKAGWDTLGPYTIEWTEEQASRNTHVSGDYVDIKAEDEGKFNKKFTKHLWHCDSLAWVKGQRLSSFILKDYFKADQGPNRTALKPDTLKILAEKATADVQKVKEELSKDCVKATNDSVGGSR